MTGVNYTGIKRENYFLFQVLRAAFFLLLWYKVAQVTFDALALITYARALLTLGFVIKGCCLVELYILFLLSCVAGP